MVLCIDIMFFFKFYEYTRGKSFSSSIMRKYEFFSPCSFYYPVRVGGAFKIRLRMDVKMHPVKLTIEMSLALIRVLHFLCSLLLFHPEISIEGLTFLDPCCPCEKLDWYSRVPLLPDYCRCVRSEPVEDLCVCVLSPLPPPFSAFQEDENNKINRHCS